MKSPYRHLFVLICLGIAVAASWPLQSAFGNVVEQRIVIGNGFWNDDNYTIHASISLGGGLPDGGYYVHFTEHNGAASFNAPFEIINGQPSPAVFDWAAFHYQARFVPDGGTTIAAVSVFGPGGTAPASGGITVWRRDVYFPDGNVPEEVGHDFYFNVFVGAGGPTPSPTPLPNTKCNDDKLGGKQGNCSPCSPSTRLLGTPMAQYSVHSMLVSLNIQDTPLRYAPPFGPPVAFSVTYNQKESQQPLTFSYSNLGPKWTFGWLSYVTDHPTTQLPSTSVYLPGGGAEVYPFNSGSQTFSPDPQSHALLVRTGPDSYERQLSDGSKQVFDRSTGGTTYPRKIFMTAMIDPAGNSLSIDYDSSLRVTTITDALGQETLVSYELATDPLKITKVTDPFGRFATFQYENDKLKTITDEVGIQSQFTYQSGTDSIDSLTTPYGTTNFVSGVNGTNRWIEITDPLGGQERVEYRDQAPGISATDPVAPNASGITNAGLDVANTFYWDKKAMAEAPGDYTKARIKHWLYNANGSVSGILSSEKQALENRVWSTYLGQPDYQHVGSSANPSQVARVLGDGTTQLSQFEYNSLGKTTKETDPVGRVMSHIYASNHIDLLETRQTRGTNNELLRQLTYDSLHQPLTDTDAAGQVTTYTYNTVGQILTRTNAKSETTTYAYGDTVPAGYIASITSPPVNGTSAVVSFGYDSFNRVRTVTSEADQYTVTTDYDNIDRPITVTYPDGTNEEFLYKQNFGQGTTTILDLTASRDRLGRWTYRHYDANRQMDSMTDPANRTTQYGWCTCGSLNSITDPNGNVTTFNRDLQGRVYQKVFADTSTVDYLFEGQTAPNTAGATSRLQSSTDALNRRTNYSYFIDNNLSEVTYTDTSGGPLSPPTPSVNYTYDSDHDRLTAMSDGTGLTAYTYHAIPGLGAGKLQSIDGPLTDDTVSFIYDELGRTTEEAINNVFERVEYDSLGRLASTKIDSLGHISFTYDGVTPRLQTVNYPNGQTTNYTYFGNNDDRRLQTLENLGSGAINLSKFDYTYNAEGEITSWISLLQAASSGRWFEYDNARQLTSARNASNPSFVSEQMDYGYDDAGNRITDAIFNPTGMIPNGLSHSYRQNALNQITILATQDGWWNAAAVYPVYDLAGNMIDDGDGNTFEWDAANRLIAINARSTRSEFTYDGLSRRVAIVERSGGMVTSTKQFVWVGTRIADERDSHSLVTRRYYAEGEERLDLGGSYYYTRDHLGSIRELTDGSGAIQASYDYDPYGKRTKLSGSLDVDFGYTGHYHHAPSDLNLTLYRAYDPALGRWLSRDPIGEAGGLNLYGYVENNSVNLVDPLGLTWRSNINFLLSWLGGGGRNNRAYTSGSLQVREMQNSPGANALRDEFYDSNCAGVGRFDYDSWEAAFDTLINPWTRDWSSTSAQVGGFAGASALNNGDGTVTFMIPNTAGAHSFFYHLVPDRTGTRGPMRNIRQTFTWTEPIHR